MRRSDVPVEGVDGERGLGEGEEEEEKAQRGRNLREVDVSRGSNRGEKDGCR